MYGSKAEQQVEDASSVQQSLVVFPHRMEAKMHIDVVFSSVYTRN